jgi:hypothetical protein
VGVLKLKPVGVVLESRDAVELIRGFVDDECHVVVGRDLRDALYRLQAQVELPSMILCDGRINESMLTTIDCFSFSTIVISRALRFVPKEWKARTVEVVHSEVGGVTSTRSAVSVLARSASGVGVAAVEHKHGRDASTVLMAIEWPSGHRNAPPHRHVTPLGVEEVAPNIYHGGGLLPHRCSKGTTVLTPCIGAKPGQWGVRRLTGSEVLAALDVPVALIAHFVADPSVVTNHFLKNVTPGLSCVAAFRALVCPGETGLENGICPSGLENGGGTNKLSPPTSKRKRSGEKRVTFELDEEIEAVKQGKGVKRANKSLEGNGKESYLTETKEEVKEGVGEMATISRDIRERKATKSDDAAVPEYLWRESYVEASAFDWVWEEFPRLDHAFTVVRKHSCRQWKRNVGRSFWRWFRKRHRVPRGGTSCVVKRRDRYEWADRTAYSGDHEAERVVGQVDLEAARDAIGRTADSNWWEWTRGSRPLHWRWPEEYVRDIRDGVEIHVKSQLPLNHKPQKDVHCARDKELVTKKLQVARGRNYIAGGGEQVMSLTTFFHVPKGEEDIRMVYDGTASGLNDSLWVPRFAMPTIRTHLRGVEPGTFMADVDIGEMFLNFMLHPAIRPYAGVDLSHFFPSKDGTKVWESWWRNAMGLTSSPYCCCQAMGFAEEIIKGDRLDPTNVFRWSRVRLNLPGSDNYDPRHAWVSKVRDADGRIAADVYTFVDDLRPVGPTKQDAWKAARRAASTLNWLGIQDAPRKRRGSTLTPGAWQGGVLRTDGGEVRILTSQEKWDKTKAMLQEIRGMLSSDPVRLPRKRLEEIRGFLNYVCQTYRSMTPYLIGFHMTIDGWRRNRHADGWKMSGKECLAKLEGGTWVTSAEDIDAPKFVRAVPRLWEDILALTRLASASEPPPQRVRASKIANAYYGFADASGAGFGATIDIDGVIEYEYGQWSSQVAEESSSNWRELNNLVEAIKRVVKHHAMAGCELFLFTDNTTAENAFWKGSSSSRLLFDLVLELKELEMNQDMIIHVIHVSGKRMISQGTDGLSRSDLSEGVMVGKPMRSFIPLHLNAMEREPTLREWLRCLTKGLSANVLTPEDWFGKGHTGGTHIWTPPPAAAEVVVEQLGFARLKRPHAMHIVVVPRLMTGMWRRHMGRGTDFYFKVDWKDVWDLTTHFEPLFVYIALPYRTADPQLERRKEFLERLSRFMLRDDLPPVFGSWRRSVLRQFLLEARKLCSL